MKPRTQIFLSIRKHVWTKTLLATWVVLPRSIQKMLYPKGRKYVIAESVHMVNHIDLEMFLNS